MKYILTFLLALTLQIAHCQTVKLDTPANMAYAEIYPIEIGWLKGTPAVSRVCISVSNFNLVNSTDFTWYLKYPVTIDSNTTQWQTIMSGGTSMHVNSAATIEDARAYLFNWVSDSLNLDITYK